MGHAGSVKALLAELATSLDGPDGSGGGAVCLAAITEIETLEAKLRPPVDPG